MAGSSDHAVACAWELPAVPVWSDKYGAAWPADNGRTRAQLTPLGDALTQPYRTDAHFAQYAASVRLSRESIAATERRPRMVALIIDVDAPQKQRTQAWDADLSARAGRLSGSPCGYYTRNGARLVWLCDGVSIEAWSQHYVSALVDLVAVAGIVGDIACHDWTRLFRVPHGTRDGARQSHGWLCGSPDAIGWHRLMADDATRAKARAWLVAHRPDYARVLAPPASEAPSVSVDTRRPPNVSRIVEDALERVRTAANGGRNRELYSQACWLAKLVSRGELDKASAEHGLVAAAVAAGVAKGEARATVRSAMRGR